MGAWSYQRAMSDVLSLFWDLLRVLMAVQMIYGSLHPSQIVLMETRGVFILRIGPLDMAYGTISKGIHCC